MIRSNVKIIIIIIIRSCKFLVVSTDMSKLEKNKERISTSIYITIGLVCFVVGPHQIEPV